MNGGPFGTDLSDGFLTCRPRYLMTNQTLSTTLGKARHLILVSYFESPDGANTAVADLMAEGLSEQDFSLLRLSGGRDDGHVDLLEYLAAPLAGRQSNLTEDTEGAPDRESNIGGGIGTTSPDDNVSAVHEMDDSESAAEELMYPADGTSSEEEDASQLKAAAVSGFFDTTRPEAAHARASERALEEIDLPGLGVLVGEGSFGASVLERVFEKHQTSMSWLADEFNRRDGTDGVSIGVAGAVLAIDVNFGGPNPDRIEEVLLARHAKWIRKL